MKPGLVLVVGVAACSDTPSLRIDVHHDTDVEITRTTISVYESATLGCDQIEFGDLTEDQLVAVRVAELVTDLAHPPTGSLDGLSRADPKIIVARGYDAAGTLQTAGCGVKGLVVEDDAITIATGRTSIASIGQLVLDGAAPYSLPVTLTDAQGTSLGGHRVSWRVYAPAGTTPATTPNAVTLETTGVWQLAQPACTSDLGVQRLHPVPPSTIGGFAVQVRPSWAATSPPLLTSFTRIDPALSPMVPVSGVDHPCAIRVGPVSGALVPRIVCIEQTAASGGTIVAREYAVTTAIGAARLQQVGGDAPIDQDVIAVFGIERAGGLRDVYAVTRKARVFGLFGPSAPPPNSLPHLGALEDATDALLLPACGEQPARLVMRTQLPSGRRLVAMDPLGGAATGFHGITAGLVQLLQLRSAGCMTELDPGGSAVVRQAAAIDLGARDGVTRQTTSVYFTCGAPDPTRCFVDLPVPRAGVGFTLGGEPRLAGINLDATGVVVSQWVVLPDGAGYRRVERERVAAASIPLHIVFAQLDADGVADAFWDIPTLDGESSSFQITYAQKAGTQPLSTLSTAQPVVATDVLVGDVTGDGKDDLVLFGSTVMTNPSTGEKTRGDGLVVIPTQIEASLPAGLGADAPCP